MPVSGFHLRRSGCLEPSASLRDGAEGAPTTRGFASILAQGLGGLTADQVLNVPDDYPNTIGLTEAVSPLRIRGMTALLWRTKRQVREKLVA